MLRFLCLLLCSATAIDTAYTSLAAAKPQNPLQPSKPNSVQSSPPDKLQLPPKTDAELDDEAKRADDLRTHSQLLPSLPLYEDLHARRPQNPLYTAGLGLAYIGKAGHAASAAEASAATAAARQLLLLAQSQGDRSVLVQVMLDKLTPANAAARVPPSPPAVDAETFRQAEQLFVSQNFQQAADLYRKVWEQNPQYYAAALYAGDCEFRLNRYDEAAVWFSRAVAINQDIETAHRYWADDLAKAGKPQEAEKQYVEALLADPYDKGPRSALRSWLGHYHLALLPPPITLPAVVTRGSDGAPEVNIDPPKAGDPLAAAWLTYSNQNVAWRNTEFLKRFPNEKTYRHTLAEESESLHNVLATVSKMNIPEDTYDATLRSLMALEKDGMIDCWILLDNSDPGITQDFVKYRETHRELLRAYIAKYDIHVVRPIPHLEN